uniref:Uncharacterized protein n=1 Tax=Arundo donax TaxID=35708 RepID=A0A0A9FJU9_ARUDO
MFSSVQRNYKLHLPLRPGKQCLDTEQGCRIGKNTQWQC